MVPKAQVARGQWPGWLCVQPGNENGIVQGTSHLLSRGKKGSLRTQPPDFHRSQWHHRQGNGPSGHVTWLGQQASWHLFEALSSTAFLRREHIWGPPPDIQWPLRGTGSPTPGRSQAPGTGGGGDQATAIPWGKLERRGQVPQTKAQAQLPFTMREAGGLGSQTGGPGGTLPWLESQKAALGALGRED